VFIFSHPEVWYLEGKKAIKIQSITVFYPVKEFPVPHGRVPLQT